MAGANNAQMKAAGWRARDITKARATIGRVSHGAMAEAGFSPRKGFEPVSRAAAPARPAGEAPAGWRAAARGEGGEARRAANAAREAYVGKRALETYRSRAADYDRASDAGKVANRMAVRAQLARYNEASIKASNSGNPTDNVRAKNERAKLDSLLASRDAIARGRKQASTPGQGDLFGMSRTPRGPSPFEREVAARTERLAAAGERAKGLRGSVLPALSGTLARRKDTAANAAREDRAALLAARLQNRAVAALGTARADAMTARLQRLVEKYPNAGRTGAQIRMEQSLEARKAVQRIMRTTMGRSTDRASAGLPPERSPRMQSLLNRANAGDAKRQATRQAVKNTLAGRVADVAKSRSKKPARADLSREDRAAMIGARLLERAGRAGQTRPTRSKIAYDRYQRVMAKYPGAAKDARSLRDERQYASAKAKGSPVTRRQMNLGPKDERTTRLLKAMKK